MQSQSVHEMDRVPTTESVSTHEKIFVELGKTINLITRAMDKVHPFEPTVKELGEADDILDQAFEKLNAVRLVLNEDIYGKKAEPGKLILSERRLHVEVSTDGTVHITVEKE